jgi:hypothetical protein
MKELKNILSFLFLFMAFASASFGQRINFSTWTGSDDVTIMPVGASGNTMRFNDKEKVLRSNMPVVSISKIDPQVAIFEIEAPTEFDITVDLNYPSVLYKDGNTSSKDIIPFSLNMSYTIQGRGSLGQIPNAATAQDVPLGFNSVTLPMYGEGMAAPLPPSPEFGGSVARPKSKVYLFIYGSIGPIGTVSAGNYTADVILTVNVSGGDN